jgi:thiamine-phosphate pyrophosphorylase
VTDRSLARGDLEDVVSEAVAEGVDWVQIREKDLTGGPLLELSRRVARAARRGALSRGPSAARVRVVVNRRSDVALALGPEAEVFPDDRIDGVHLGFDGVNPAEARRVLGPEAWIGASCHTPPEVRAACEAGANYLHLAPIFPPNSKTARGQSLGLPALADGAACGIAVLAQGGIHAENAREVLAAGAAGVAVTGAILMAADPGKAASALRRALDGGPPGR